MLAARPFVDDTALLDTAERAWWQLEPGDWIEAFSCHPRIGEGGRSATANAEQAGMRRVRDEIRRAIAHGNREYEQRFGYIFLICATGRTAEEMAQALDQRMKHDPPVELRVAAGEQAKITRLRLERLGMA